MHIIPRIITVIVEGGGVALPLGVLDLVVG
jgi:hypothetical protein